MDFHGKQALLLFAGLVEHSGVGYFWTIFGIILDKLRC